MILNAYTIIMLFIAVLTGILAIPLGILSFKIYRKWGNPLYDEEKTAMVNRSYLLLLTAIVILFIKLLSWPFFYVTLQSYVPGIHGAMCIFGVTRIQPVLSGIVQILKPLVFFSIGGWLLLNRLDRKTETSPLFKRKFIFLSIVSVMIILDSVGDLIYFTGFDIKMFVSCCTTFFDIPERTTAMLPVSVLGEGYDSYMLPVYYASNILLIVFLVAAYPHLLARGLCLTAAGVVLMSLNTVITVFAMFEVIAPKIMNMPLHHCIYCMWQYSPDSVFITAFFILGMFSCGWAFALQTAGRHKETDILLKGYLRNLYLFACLTTAASLLMVTIHLLFKG
jgi:hypothetical protein